jgi:hypothetical protein
MKRAALVLVVAFALALAGPAGALSKKHKLPSPHIGQVAKDGNFAFVVKQVQCGVPSIGTTQYLQTTAPAGSQFCLVTMSVKNDKGTARSFFASNQHAIDKHGHSLNPDDSALAYLPNDTAASYTTLNPGISITVVVPFQIATADKIKTLQLHDSAFSGGVTVYNVG